MQFDDDTVLALTLLLGPVGVLAYRHRVEWGGGFGLSSGLWKRGAVIAACLLLAMIIATGFLGADDFRAAMGGRRTGRFVPSLLFPGVGLAVAIFPGPASELAGRYKELAAEKATHTFAIVGWCLFAYWAFMLCFGWFARNYRSH
ncbi:MAG TPA: hypothetical protein VGD45_08600 [Steroidobacter sp.]|uniref:hypothetical protein n=1 Tax=Steroidobacter sp. TaxID=1978227 RepID=UPI002ED7C1DC